MHLHSPVKFLLWVALAAAGTFALVSQFSVLSLALVGVVAAAIVYWLSRHIGEVRAAYLSKEAAAALPSSQDKILWGNKAKPRLRDIAPGLVLMGLACFYFSYEVSQGAAPTKFAKLGYELFGMPGAVGAWCFAGVALLAAGVEAIIGSRSKQD